MTIIEYCDNENCNLNRNYKCTAGDVSFDNNAICLTAKYKDEHADLVFRDVKEEKEINLPEAPTPKKKKDDWIKYI